MIAFGYLKLTQFFSKFAYLIVGIVALFLLALAVSNYSSVVERLGFETRTSLKSELAKEEVKTALITQSNTNLIEEIEKEKKSAEVTVAVLDKLKTTKATTAAKIDKIKTKKNKAIAKVTKADIESSSQPSTITLSTNNHYTKEVVQQVSVASIDAIWAAYNEIKSVS